MDVPKEHNPQKRIGLSFLTLSQNYLILVKNILQESIQKCNPHFVIQDIEITEKQYSAITKWTDFSDFNVKANKPSNSSRIC